MTKSRKKSELWYTKWAEKWEQALPVGNGRLGGMDFGRIWDDTLQLNEESINYDGKRERINPQTREYFEQIRQLTFDGKAQEAENLAVCAWSGTPYSMSDYQPLGNLFLRTENRWGEVTEYCRSLDLSSAVMQTEYTMGNAHDRREVFASHPDDVIVYRWECDTEPVSLRILLHRDHFYAETVQLDAHTVAITFVSGKEKNVAMMRVLPDAADSCCVIGESILLKRARSFTVLLTGASTYRQSDPLSACRETLDRAGRYSYEELRARHVKDYQSLYNRMSLTLTPEDEKNDIPTDQRLAALRERVEQTQGSTQTTDLLLTEQLFAYSRYLTISASRAGTLPMNLQGIWSDKYEPGWGCRYTVNINTQMNYWPTEASNLSECHTVLLDHMYRMLPRGQQCAREMYGCRGFVCHHNTDVYGDCAPQDIWVPGSYWVLGGAWLCLHLWQHYRYTRDREYLRRAYTILQQSCLFFEDFLQENRDGYLVICPSVSPENTYFDEKGNYACFAPGVAMDTEILHELFTATAEACEILGEDADFARRVREMDARLLPIRIGKNGNIVEWDQDYREEELGHRHISHLFGLYPARQFTPQDGELFDAARVTLERRLSNGGAGTGWSRAWVICMWARLLDGEQALENIHYFFARSVYDNLFCAHPPFQIDGNFGIAAGMLEMLLQTDREGNITLLPALPQAWAKQGSVRGICTENGDVMDFSWRDGKIVSQRTYARTVGAQDSRTEE